MVNVMSREEMKEAIAELRQELSDDIREVEREIRRVPSISACQECGVVFKDPTHSTTLLKWCPVCKRMVSTR